MKNNTKTRIVPQNVATYYRVAKIFQLSNLSESAAKYIQRWFTTFSETDNFLELDFHSLKMIISSSELHITSEIEVFNAVDAWISHDFSERNKHSKHLLSKVRLSLLSKHALEYILEKNLSIKMNEECRKLIKEGFKQNKMSFNPGFTAKKLETRYCNQNYFDIFHCGNNFLFYNGDQSSFFEIIDGKDMIRSENVPSLPGSLCFDIAGAAVVTLKNSVYLFNCSRDENSNTKLVQKYSVANDSLETVGKWCFDSERYCACGFIDHIYFFGGNSLKSWTATATCRSFNTNDRTWTVEASMKEGRQRASCAVFEERIVVAGGIGHVELNTVEVYDPIACEWSDIPDMVEARYGHKLVAVKNKLFVVGGRGLNEMYDSLCNFFVSLTPPTSCLNRSFNFSLVADVINTKNKIFVFFKDYSEALIYYVERNEWVKIPCCKTTSISFFNKIPKLNF